jgi:tetratricopeptide (TPR) repeat protein
VRFEFINFDDQDYVTENEVIWKGITFEGIKWAFSFTENDLTYWHPIAYIAHMVDCQLFGTHPGYHHMSNVFIHALNAILLYLALLYMTGARFSSAFAACLLAVHPIGVDSVAWISQKKTLLATFFWLLTLFSYAWYSQKINFKRYSALCFFVAMGLMTKPVMVTIPIILFIFDFWPLNRVERFDHTVNGRLGSVQKKYSIKWLIVEKIPLMVLVFLWGITPFISEHVTAKNITFDVVPFVLRFKNAVVSYFQYLKKFFFPVDLAFLYPYPKEVSTLFAVLSVMGIVIISYTAVRYIRKYPYAATGWFAFLIVLVPFLGFVQGAVWPAYADRFAYVPFIGLYIVFAWGLVDLASHNVAEIALRWVTSCIAVISLAILSFFQTGYWKNNITLYSHALKVTKGNYLAHNNLGIAYDERGDYDEARSQYDASLSINPSFSKAHHNLAVNLLKKGDTDKAIEHFKLSLISNPENPVAKYNLANIAMGKGYTDEAIALYQSAIADNPNFSDAYNNLGVILSQKGLRNESLENFKRALVHNPSNISAISNLGNELFDMGRLNDARMCFTRALSLDSKNIKVMNDLGVLYAAMGKNKEAELLFSKVIEIEPDNQTAKANLSLIVKEKEQLELQIATARNDYETNPTDLKKILFYAGLYEKNGDFKKAEALYLNALTQKPDSLETLVALSEMYEKEDKYAKAIIYYGRLADTHAEKKAAAYYQIACLYATQSQADESIRWLQAAADSGFTEWSHLNHDLRFDMIRNSKRFQEFIALTGSQTK